MTDTFENARTELDAYVRTVCGPHHPAYNAPSTLDRLLVWAAVSGTGRSLPVWSGGSERTIYRDPTGNYAFRAWHDRTHIRLCAGFDHKGELAVALEHQRQGERDGLSEDALRLLWVDTYGQFFYGRLHNGEFVTDQVAFARHAFTRGIEAACQYTY